MSTLSPWIDGFSKTIRQNLPFIKGMVSQKMKSEHIYQTLLKAGPAGRKKEVLRMIADVRAATKDVNTYLDQSNPLAYPNPDLIPMALGRQTKAYNYLIEYQGKSAITGFNFTEQVTISSSRLLRVQEMYDEVEESTNPYGYVDTVIEEGYDVKEIHYSDNPYFIT